TVVVAGTVSAGAVVSTTRTVNVGFVTLPCVSLAAHTTVVVPSGKLVPGVREQTTGRGPSTRSLAEGARHVTTAPARAVASTVISDGTPENAGGVRSATVTLKVAKAALPCESAALHATLVVPVAKMRPEAGEQTTWTEPSTASSAIGRSYV